MLSVQSLIESGRRDLLFFWGHRQKGERVDRSCLSQWYERPFGVEDRIYRTAEHYMMAGKARFFGDDAAEREVLAALDPRQAKAVGRKVSNFDENQWKAARYPIVVRGNMHKFSQHPDLREFLLSTGDAVLVEASPYDAIWGIKLSADDPRAADPAQWLGLNLLGFALMDVREKLR